MIGKWMRICIWVMFAFFFFLELGYSADTVREETILSGETLATFSYRIFGTHQLWREIYDANKNRLTSPDVVSLGTKLRIPELQEMGLSKKRLRYVLKVSTIEEVKNGIRRLLDTATSQFEAIVPPQPERDIATVGDSSPRERSRQILLPGSERLAKNTVAFAPFGPALSNTVAVGPPPSLQTSPSATKNPNYLFEGFREQELPR